MRCMTNISLDIIHDVNEETSRYRVLIVPVCTPPMRAC